MGTVQSTSLPEPFHRKLSHGCPPFFVMSSDAIYLSMHLLQTRTLSKPQHNHQDFTSACYCHLILRPHSSFNSCADNVL